MVSAQCACGCCLGVFWLVVSVISAWLVAWGLISQLFVVNICVFLMAHVGPEKLQLTQNLDLTRDCFYLIWAATVLIASEQAILFQLEINLKNAHGSSVSIFQMEKKVSVNQEVNCVSLLFYLSDPGHAVWEAISALCPAEGDSLYLNLVVALCGQPGDIWQILTPCSPLNFLYSCEHLRPRAICSGDALKDQMKRREWEKKMAITEPETILYVSY